MASLEIKISDIEPVKKLIEIVARHADDLPEIMREEIKELLESIPAGD